MYNYKAEAINKEREEKEKLQTKLGACKDFHQLTCKSVEEEYLQLYKTAKRIFEHREKLIVLCRLLANDLEQLKEVELGKVKQSDYQNLVEMAKMIVELYEV